MTKYFAKQDVWLSHENRMVKEGETFETSFPKVKTTDGKEVNMTLDGNIILASEAAKNQAD